jgi:hypothetical protein
MDERELKPGQGALDAAGVGDTALDYLMAGLDHGIISAIGRSVDLDAGLAQIIGDPPRLERPPAARPPGPGAPPGPRPRRLRLAPEPRKGSLAGRRASRPEAPGGAAGTRAGGPAASPAPGGAPAARPGIGSRSPDAAGPGEQPGQAARRHRLRPWCAALAAIAALMLILAIMLNVTPLAGVAVLCTGLIAGSLGYVILVSCGIHREERSYFRSRGHPAAAAWRLTSLYGRPGFGDPAAPEQPGPVRGARWKDRDQAMLRPPAHGDPQRPAGRPGNVIPRPRSGRSRSRQAASLPSGHGDTDPDPDGEAAGPAGLHPSPGGCPPGPAARLNRRRGGMGTATRVVAGCAAAGMIVAGVLMATGGMRLASAAGTAAAVILTVLP